MPPKRTKVAPAPKKQPSREASTSDMRHSSPPYQHRRRLFEEMSSSGTSEDMQEPTPKRVAKECDIPKRRSPRLSQSLPKQKQPRGTQPSSSSSDERRRSPRISTLPLQKGKKRPRKLPSSSSPDEIHISSQPSTSQLLPSFQKGRHPGQESSSSDVSRQSGLTKEPTPKRVAKERGPPQRRGPRLLQSLQKQKQPRGTLPSSSSSDERRRSPRISTLPLQKGKKRPRKLPSSSSPDEIHISSQPSTSQLLPSFQKGRHPGQESSSSDVSRQSGLTKEPTPKRVAKERGPPQRRGPRLLQSLQKQKQPRGTLPSSSGSDERRRSPRLQKGKKAPRKLPSSSSTDEIYISPQPSTSQLLPSFQKGRQPGQESSSSDVSRQSGSTKEPTPKRVAKGRGILQRRSPRLSQSLQKQKQRRGTQPSSSSSDERRRSPRISTPPLQKGKKRPRKLPSSSSPDEIHISPQPSTSQLLPSFQKGRQPGQESSSSDVSRQSGWTKEPTPKRVAKERGIPQRRSPRLSQSLQKQKQPRGTQPSSSSSDERRRSPRISTPPLQKGKKFPRKLPSSSSPDEIHTSLLPSTSQLSASFQKGRHPSQESSSSDVSRQSDSTKEADPEPGTPTETDAPTAKKKRRRQMEYVTFANKTFKVSGKVAAEVKKLQRTTHNLIPKLPFRRLLKEILMTCGFTREHRITDNAVEALQTSSEMHIVEIFEDAMSLAMHARRMTCMPVDIAFARELRRKRGLN